ncbi:D-alanyl-D-alanine carboxypeptidase family protein [Alteribacter aurantiacus]|uniref:D-alanyl-D-alanine carboxypeptidase family protein n=1 Tax=Alteribacter aurantiacus TaxID=254410 RepID=UPI000408CCEA|nr:D-alanyl-D-alanine carboxypeptidase family protein [Alteribacter aurantiacus]
MGKFKVTVMSFMAFVLLFSSVFTFADSAEAGYDPGVETAILLDADSGKILLAKNIDQALPPASMTKMMSEYLILEAVNNGDISWDQEVPISNQNAALSHSGSLSNVMLRTDESYSVKELYESVAIYSANAATMALAELIAGSEGAFVEKMNERAKDIGMGEPMREAGSGDLESLFEQGVGDFQFVNSTGLPNSLLGDNYPQGTEPNDDNYMSARAAATLAFHLVNDYPEVLDTASIPEKMFKEGTSDEIRMQNWNWMIEGTMYADLDYEYADGLKTGFTNAAGYTFTGTAERDGKRLISVVMGADSEAHRFQETQRLMEWGFNQFSTTELFPEGMAAEGEETVPVSKGKESQVAVSTEEAVSLMIRNGQEENYSYEVEWDESLLNENGELQAPIEAGEVVGKLHVVGDENDPGFLDGEGSASVNIVTDEAVERAGWFSLLFRSIGGFFAGVWTSVSDTVTGWF